MTENPEWEAYWKATERERHYQAKLSREGYRPPPGRMVVAVWSKQDRFHESRQYMLWSNAELVTRRIVGQDTPAWSEGKRFKRYSDALLKDIDSKLRALGYVRNYVTDTETRRACDKARLRPSR